MSQGRRQKFTRTFRKSSCVNAVLFGISEFWVGFGASIIWWQKKNNKQKTHKHFSDGPCGTIVPGTNPHPSQGQTGQNGDFTVELNRKRPVCPRDRSQFVPGRGPVFLGPRDGSCLSGHRPAQNVSVHWFFSRPILA